MGITKIGIEGEQKLFKLLHDRGYHFFQPDTMAKKNGKWFVFETKQKERFNPPPFEGHGLDTRQVRARLDFQKETGIEAILVIFEVGTNNVYMQSFTNLELGEYFDTKNGVRVYKLSSFISLTKGKESV